MKQKIGQIDATPSKRVYSSIIADYSLSTGICELVDNAIDQWARDGKSRHLNVAVTIELGQQTIMVSDNAGGLEKNELGLIVTPGNSNQTGEGESIGLFGVGSKRAVVALAQQVQIRTRRKSAKTHLLEFDDHWLKDGAWNMDFYEVDQIDPSSTFIELAKLRFSVDGNDVEHLREHLAATYAKFLQTKDVTILLQGKAIAPLIFENWAFPPDYSPHLFKGELVTEEGETILLESVAGLINEPGSIAGEYGVYFYCNDRLVAKALKSFDVGFVAGLAGAPHNVVSLVRVLISLKGPAKCMPWNSSKSGINVNHRIFKAIQKWLTQTVTGFANVCKRLHGDWDEQIFKYPKGNFVNYDITDFDKVKKGFLPPLPAKKVKYAVALYQANAKILATKPWTQGLYEADIAVELIQKQNLQQKNRLALILLDSSLEIAFKDFLVNESGKYFTDAQLVTLFASRHNVENEVKTHVTFPPEVWKKLKFFYGLRCKLVHERSSASISDEQIEDYKNLVHKVLSRLFKLKWLKD